MSKKKIIMIIVCIVLILAIIGGLVYFLGIKGKTEKEETISKIDKVYSELKEKQEYSFKTTLDEQNEIFYAKKDGVVYLDTIYEGEESKIIIKDGNSYLLLDDEKEYYTYQNNETDSEKVTEQLEEIKEKQYTEGKEKIENKEYKYEEYEGTTEFLLKEAEEVEEQTAKTRFYFDGNKLVYIKTIAGDYQELLKVDISYQVDDNLFEIPSDYEEM